MSTCWYLPLLFPPHWNIMRCDSELGPSPEHETASLMEQARQSATRRDQL